MKPSELFDVVIRTFGLFLLIVAGSQLLVVAIQLIGGGGVGGMGMLLMAIPSFVVGAWFLRGAPFVLDYAYGPDPGPSLAKTELERDTQQAMALLKAGKTAEAKVIVDKILST